MKFTLEHAPIPTPVVVDGRPTAHLTDHPEEQWVKFLCGSGAESETLVTPPDDKKMCQRCEAGAAGDARAKRVSR